MPTCLNCENDFPVWTVIDGKRRNLQRRKYCLECSPFGKHNTRQLHKADVICTCDTCSREFVYDRSLGHRRYRCNSCLRKEHRDSVRQWAVDLAGGKCSTCGYDRCLRALDFHHRDPADKDFAIAKGYGLSRAALREEIRKCDLLCRNCHAEEHDRLYRVERARLTAEKRAMEKAHPGLRLCKWPHCRQPLAEQRQHCSTACVYKAGVARHRERTRRKLIRLKGGECLLCEYSKCDKALNLHHRNEVEKEFTLDGHNIAFAWERVLTEAEKCEVLCGNCHSELHDGLVTLKGAGHLPEGSLP